jgi:translocation protein SEC62
LLYWLYIQGKRVVRLLLSESYKKKASKSKSILPKINSRDDALTAFRLLQASLLALRVEKVSAHHGHDHENDSSPEKSPKSTTKDSDKKKKKKKKSPTAKPKPPQNLQIQRDQSSFSETDYFAWFFETTQLQTLLGAVGIVILVFAAILFPLWPPMMRTGVWYLSIALLGLIAGIAVIAVVRLILFVITMFAVPPGIWLFPNLFEDVGFFESFVPLWAWQKVPKAKKKKGADGSGGGVTSKEKDDGGGVETTSVVAAEKSLHTTVEDASDDE